ncbi:hypothetical protein SBA3_320002 [Candidatus Sulfopaludibacter sp. SbA3]|nr:hypothetical protein SBA3_320002 [Candidatus Sulfopaludibacter sp. SbA3]
MGFDFVCGSAGAAGGCGAGGLSDSGLEGGAGGPDSGFEHSVRKTRARRKDTGDKIAGATIAGGALRL